MSARESFARVDITPSAVGEGTGSNRGEGGGLRARGGSGGGAPFTTDDSRVQRGRLQPPPSKRLSLPSAADTHSILTREPLDTTHAASRLRPTWRAVEQPGSSSGSRSEERRVGKE